MKPELQKCTRCFVRALTKLTATDLQRLRNESGRARGNDVAVNDLFNDIWRALPRREPYQMRRACWLVTTLFPWNRRHLDQAAGLPESLGEGFARLRRSARKDEDRKRIEHRFLRLLDAHGQAFEDGLLDAVRLLERKSIPVHWENFVLDLADWESPGQFVQQKWFRDFRGLGKGE